MFSLHTIDVTTQRIEETRGAIEAQRAYVAQLADPILKAIASRTLTTLEDMLLIMQRTHGLLVETTYAEPLATETVDSQPDGAPDPAAPLTLSADGGAPAGL